MDERASEQSIFLHAIGLGPPADRAAYLDEACRDHPQLRAELDALLAAHDRLGGVPPSGPAPAAGPVAIAEGFPAVEREHAGSVIGPYKLLEVIGEGGMGTVYMAEQTRPIRRRVALKVIRSGMDSRQIIARFEAERQALALMDHPSIAKVLEAGTTDGGAPYFVMELVKGVPITRFCDEGRLTLRQRLELFVPVCRAVQHAHQKGIIHRDLKPSNVLVGLYDGRPVPKIIDFGVAKATGPRPNDATLLTGFGAVVGTPEYMSPEQARLENLDIDTRSDVYSLGVLIYELITGTTPLDRRRLTVATLLEVLRFIREEDPPRPSTRLDSTEELPSIAASRGVETRKLAGLVRGELDWIVMKALEKERSRRYETANDLARDLERFLAGEPVQACPPSAAYRLRKLVRRHRTSVLAVSLLALSLILGTAVSTWLAIRATNAERLAEGRLVAETLQRERAEQSERRGRQRLFEARLAQARAGRWSGQAGRRFDGLAALSEAARIGRGIGIGDDRIRELRDEAIATLALADVRRIEEWIGLPVGVNDLPTFDADLNHYARSDQNGNISVCRVGEEEELVRLPGGGVPAWFMRFSPDGQFLAAAYVGRGRPAECRVWNWRERSVHFQPPGRIAGRAALDFSPDGERLAVGQDDGTVSIHEVRTGEVLNRVKMQLSPYTLAFHPDGTKLATAGSSGRQVHVYDLATGGLLFDEMASGRVYQVRWHPGGVRFATACAGRAGKVDVWSLVTGGHHALLEGHEGDVEGLAFSPDGNLLVSYSFDGTSRFWDADTGDEVLRFAGRVNHFSRDARRLAGRTGDRMFVCDLETGAECRTLSRLDRRPGEVYHGDIHAPDGRWLAVGGAEGVHVWDLARGEERAFLPLENMQDWTSGGEVRFDAARGELVTANGRGRFRWGWREEAGVLSIGPPTRFQDAEIDEIVDAIRLQHANTVLLDVSPDRKWLITAEGMASMLKAWEAPGGRFHRELIADHGKPKITFSRDGRSLAIGSVSAFHVWDIGTGRLVREFPLEPAYDLALRSAFSPDGKVLAYPFNGSIVQLAEVATGRPIARLESPEPGLIWWLAFTPDGGRLVTSTQLGVIKVWDLRSIGERLRELDLAWDLPSFPPSGERAVSPIRVEVDLGEVFGGGRPITGTAKPAGPRDDVAPPPSEPRTVPELGPRPGPVVP